MKASNGIDTVVNGSTGKFGNSDEDDDDQDLEALRLAALESLRAKGLPPPPVKPATTASIRSHPVLDTSPFAYRQYAVNQNLISIIPIEDTSMKPEQGLNDSRSAEGTRMTSLTSISQPVSEDEDKPKVSSKFSRYEDSDSEDSDDLDLDLKKLTDESESEECELEIGVSEDLLLQSPPPPGAVPAPVLLPEKKEKTVGEVKDAKMDDERKTEPSKTPAQKLVKPEKPLKSEKAKPSKRHRSVDTKKPSSRRSPRRESSPLSKKPKSKHRTPERSLSSKEGQVKVSPARHRSRNQSPSARKPPAPSKRSSPALVNHGNKSADGRRSRSRSPPRSKKPPAENSAKGPLHRASAEHERLDARKRKFQSEVIDSAEFQPRKIKLSKDTSDKVDKKPDRKEKKPSTPTSEVKSQDRTKAVEQKEESSDLRAELQRRRVNRGLVKETTTQPSTKEGNTTESRRILVIKSKVAPPEETAGKPSIRERLGAVETGTVSATSSSSSTSAAATARIKLKRPASAAAAAPVEAADKGNHVESIEERVRRIQAMNDALLKRHLELEADKLLFA